MPYAVAKYGHQHKKVFNQVKFSSNDPDYVPTTQDNNDEMINILIISSNKYKKNNKYFRY